MENEKEMEPTGTQNVREIAAYKRDQALRKARLDKAERDILNKLHCVQADLARTYPLPHLQSGGSSSKAEGVEENRLIKEHTRLEDEEKRLLRRLENLHDPSSNFDDAARSRSPSVAASRSISTPLSQSRSSTRSEVLTSERPLFSATAERQLQDLAHEYGRQQERIHQSRLRVEEEHKALEERLASVSSPKLDDAVLPRRLPSIKPAMSTQVTTRMSHRPSFHTVPVGDGPVAEEIQKLRHSYLLDGGRSSSFLRELEALELEAHRTAANIPLAGPRPAQLVQHRPIKEQFPTLDRSASVVAIDDPLRRRLQEQIQLCEAQNQQLQTEIHNAKVASVGREPLQRRYLHSANGNSKRLSGLRQDIAVATEELQLQRIQAQLRAMRPANTSGKSLEASADLGPSPYDPRAGFAVIWDFATGIPHASGMEHCHLSVGLLKRGKVISSSQAFPSVPCSDSEYVEGGLADLRDLVAIFHAEQPFPRLSANTDVMLQIQLHADEGLPVVAGEAVQPAPAVAWTVMELFNQHHNLLSGRWKVPLRVPPMKHTPSVASLNDIVQYHRCEVHLRLLNARDLDAQRDITSGLDRRHLYHYMPIVMYDQPVHKGHLRYSQPEKEVEKPKKKSKRKGKKIKDVEVPVAANAVKRKQPVRKKGPSVPDPEDDIEYSSDSDLSVLSAISITPEPTPPPPETPPPQADEPDVILDLLGIELWRVKNVGEGRVRLQFTAKRLDGTICKVDGEDMIRSASMTDSIYKTEVQNFGKEKVVFSPAGLFEDSFLLVEVFLTPYNSGSNPKGGKEDVSKPMAAAKGTKVAASGDARKSSLLSTHSNKSATRRKSQPHGGVAVDDTSARPQRSRQDAGMYDDERLVAWTFIKIFKDVAAGVSPPDNPENPARPAGDIPPAGGEDHFRVESALRNLELYETPVAQSDLCTEEKCSDLSRQPNAMLRLRLFSEAYPRPELIDESDDSDLEDITLPREIFIQHDRPLPLSHRYNDKDPIIVFVDGARFLPDNVTVTRASGRILDKHYNPVGKEVISLPYLFSDIYNPHFVPADTDRNKLNSFTEKTSCRLDIDEPEIPRTATLGIKIYTVDGYSKRIATVGYSMLKLFVTMSTGDQPSNDTSSIKVSLNEGCHQLRIYAHAPSMRSSLSENVFKNNRFVPCATLLVRVYKNRLALPGKPPDAGTAVNFRDLIDAPSYTDGVYISSSFQPTKGEKHLYKALKSRVALPAKNSVPLLGDPTWSRVDRTDAEIAEFIKGKLSRSLDSEPYDLDLTYVSKYTPESGIVLRIDEASNLPWKKATHAIAAFSPPGSLFMGEFRDGAKYTSKLDWSSSQNNPVWNDGFWMFRRRHLHFHLYAVVMLQALDITFRRNKLKIQLASEQAWTAIPVFSDGYVFTDRFQLPLFQGRPSDAALEVLRSAIPSKGDLVGLLKDVKKVKPLDGASLTMRIADSRRQEEIENPEIVSVNYWYLPEENRSRYVKKKTDKKTMASLLPANETEESMDTKIGEVWKPLLLAAMTSWKPR